MERGLARELGLPWEPTQALRVALGRRERVIDVGEAEGRLFVNLAGIGLDARVAERFNARQSRRRGFWPYLAIGVGEIVKSDEINSAVDVVVVLGEDYLLAEPEADAPTPGLAPTGVGG